MKIQSDISVNFKKFLDSLANKGKKIPFQDISLQIFYDLFRIREAQERYGKKINRDVNYSIADIFQDLIAHYLKLVLSKNYEILLEQKEKKVRIDILIKKNEKNWAAIEIKTNVGWDRELVKGKKYLKRLNRISKKFGIPIKRIFYIFETTRNVGKKFEERYENNEGNIRKYIFCLFKQTAHPRWVFGDENLKKKYDKKEIISKYKEMKEVDFKEIIKKIK